MTEKATIYKLGIYLFTIFNVRPFIKRDKSQDENEGNRKKFNFSQPKQLSHP